MSISYAVNAFFDLVILVLLIYVLLSWFPGVNWGKEPFVSIRKFADIFFAPFRKFIPPIGMIDISPIVAFIILSVIRTLTLTLLLRFGL